MRPHRLDPVSLVFGLLFTGLGLAALIRGNGLTGLRWEWLWPALAVGAGLALVISLRSRGRDRAEPDDLYRD